MEKNDHHLVLGKLNDYLTGASITDTHDERYLQALARILVEDKGFSKSHIRRNQPLTVRAGDRLARIKVGFQVFSGERIAMVIQYAPGSLVTRRLSNLALSRAVADYQVPLVVTTNGEDGEVIDGRTGHVMGQGLSAIPEKKALEDHIQGLGDKAFAPLSQSVMDKAHRIVHACQVDGACPCDSDVRIL
ncbi:MAG: type I restriction enzyme HsdR N-terminal domain-containing protein [Desulfobacterales bacterium]|nr:type I restriction enzyme HsdR N-terminal domain-containing protein [Desulfobacterales bacterium]